MAKDHLARLVLNLVREDIDLAAISASYAGERGQPPFDPVMMTALLLYSYCCGIHSSRRMAKACRERVDFMSIVGFDAPDFRTISEFRKWHLKALSALFQQVLQLCETAVSGRSHAGEDQGWRPRKSLSTTQATARARVRTD